MNCDVSGLAVFSADPNDPAFYNDPYKTYRRMHAIGGPFVWKEYGLVCFATHDAVNAILRDRRFGRQITHVMSREDAGLPPVPGHLKPFYEFEENSMLEREPPGHTRLRTLVNRAFVSRNIEKLAPSIESLCNELMNRFPAETAFDLLPAYCEKIPVIVIADLLGVPREMADQLLDWSHKMVAMYQFNRTRRIEDEAVRATREFSAYVAELANERKTLPADDLLTALVEAQADGERLTRDELVTTVILLLNAGHEATVHAIGNAVKAILENHAAAGAGLDQASSCAAAVDELLRLDPPLHLFTRYVLEDLEYCGVSLSKGQTIALLLGAANHDPLRYRDPERLDFTRGGENHVSFGAGIHFCLGAPLARLEMGIALRVLFQRLPQLKLVETPGYANRFHFHGLKRLMVCAK